MGSEDHEIHDCALFIPIVSQHTQERLEGYFRREWKLAIDRTHDMAEQKPFLVPVVVDGTRDQEAFVPDAFRAVQWTRLPGGETPPAFVERIKRLLSPELSPLSAVSGAAPGLREPVHATRRSKPMLLAIVAVIVCATLAYLFAGKFWISNHPTQAPAASPRRHKTSLPPLPHIRKRFASIRTTRSRSPADHWPLLMSRRMPRPMLTDANGGFAAASHL